MIKVAFVDDEQWILDDLENLIDWEGEGYIKSGKAKNGIEALYMVERVKPDLLIMDIMMPGLLGLEVLEKMRNKGIAIPVLILTAHSEFTYAQQALRLGAFDYLLKPVEEEQLLKQIRLAAVNIKKDKTERERLKQLEFLKLLFAAINSLEDHTNLMEHKSRNEKKKYSCVVVKGKDSEEKLLRFIEKAEIIEQFQYVQVGNGKYTFLLELSQVEIDLKTRKSILKRTKAFCQNSDVSIGVSRTFSSLSQLGGAYRQADAMAYSYFITGRKGIFLSRSKKEDQIQGILGKIKKTRAKEDIIQILDGLQEYAKRVRADITDLERVYDAILLWLEYNGVNVEFASDWEMLYSFDSVEEMVQTIKEYINYNGRIIKSPSNAVITAIKEYTEQNFRERLTTNVFAKKFRMNISYLSNLFKLETGISYTTYLIDIRLNKAEELLKSTNLPINIVSERIGYDDCFHFSKLFKKYRNMSPSEYRSLFNRLL